MPKGASGFAPKAKPLQPLGVEPDYAALARGEPGYPSAAPPEGLPASGSAAVADLPPSVTGATAGKHSSVDSALTMSMQQHKEQHDAAPLAFSVTGKHLPRSPALPLHLQQYKAVTRAVLLLSRPDFLCCESALLLSA